MRRWLTVFLLILLPLQLSWAVAATYCAHEADPAVNHIGHHQHRHEAAAVAPEVAPGSPAMFNGPDASDASDASRKAGTATDKTADQADGGTAEKAPQKAAETTADKALTCVDDDCGFCHLGHSQPVASTAIVLPAVAGPVTTGSVPEVWSSRGPDRREKPNWPAA